MTSRPSRYLAMVYHRSRRWAGRRWRHGLDVHRERHVRLPAFGTNRRHGPVWSKRTAVRVAGAILALWIAFSLFMVLSKVTRFSDVGAALAAGTSRICGDGYGIYCTAVISLATTVLYAALLYAVFLTVSYERVTRAYRQRARADPRRLVQTVGSILGDVVGRDQLCDVLIANLRTRRIRRPQILIGPIGSGKTAVLVKIVEILADRGMVPVVLRLRDAVPGVSIQTMARRRFEELVDNDIRSAGEADRVWRQLRAENRVVVLGDGLEEALTSGIHSPDQEIPLDRDSMLRRAIRRVVEEDLPLLITSRPHDPLRGMEATIVELEPLGEGPALEYLCFPEPGRGGDRLPVQDVQRLYQLVKFADVVEAPLYLQIIQRLTRVDRLWQAFPEELFISRDSKGMDSAGVDRAELRRRLLEGWREALVLGYDHEDYALDERCRTATIDVLSALACIGLKQNRLEVRFGDLAGRTSPYSFDSAGSKTPRPGVPPHQTLWRELCRRLDQAGHSELHENLGMAATLGAELGIVEAHEDRVRFRHSLIQAYLGSRFLDAALRDEAYRQEAFYDPGREFLMALVLHSRALRAAATGPGTAHERFARETVELLLRKADLDNARSLANILDIFSAALEIDSGTRSPDPAALMRRFAAHWRPLKKDAGQFDRAVTEAKSRFVRAARTATRIAVGRRPGAKGDSAPQEVYWWLFDSMRRETDHAITQTAAQLIGTGGGEAFAVLDKEFAHVLDGIAASADPDEQTRRERTMCAWLAPMLYRSSRPSDDEAHDADVGSAENEAIHLAEANLDRWISVIENLDDGRPLISLEIALAKGFKYAANQRDPYSAARYGRDRLIEKTEWTLKHSRYWFTHLTLIQALTLCSLPNDPEEPLDYRGRGSDPQELVRYWVGIAASHRADQPRQAPSGVHPFVREAADLCVLALATRRPAEFCWIDESGVAAQVGSYSRSRASQYGQDRWIMESVGWSTLHPRAQRLVADVLLLLNLAERGTQQSQIEERLARSDRSDLPPCITTDREPLDLDRTIGAAETAHPGSNCLDGCPFRLCPYPPQGDILRHAEFNESFCAQQAILAGRPAPWQELHHRELRDFWKRMAHRARPKSPDRSGAWPAFRHRR